MNNAWAKTLNDAAGAKPRKVSEMAEVFVRAQAFHQAGHHADAQALYRQILRKYPQHLDTLLLLGQSEFQSARFDEAARCFKRATQADPRSAIARNNLAAALVAARRLDEALACADKALSLQPDYPDAHYNRANALLGLARFTEAITGFDRVIALDPKHVAALIDRGTTLHQLGRFVDAIESYDRALAIEPNAVGAFNNRGCAFKELRQADKALADFDRAVALAPDYADGWVNRGEMLILLQRVDEALASYDRALTIDPRLASAHLGRANVFTIKRNLAEAFVACQSTLAIDPNSTRALVLLSQALAEAGEAESAVACCDRALAIDPHDETALSNKIYALDFSTDCDYARHQQARSDWWQQVGAEIFERSTAPHDNDRDPARRIVLGYVSSDFRQRSPAFAFRPVLSNHDKSRFEVVCYSGTEREDAVTSTFKAVADRWRDVLRLSDDELADCIRADKVDILIDLSGHTGGNRLRVFARKPAPIQVHAWGFGTGTGLPTIDYMFSDAVVLPADARHLFAEKIWDLPCATMMEPPPTELRCLEPPVLSKGYVTYGVFNRVSKISDAAIALWARILQSNASARLLIKDTLLSDASVGAMLHEKFAARGIAPERISFLGRTTREDHLAAYGQVDVCLEPFPQGGGISTWEALYMGVPVVSKLGEGVSSRLAGAIQSAIGLPEFVAADDDGYVEIALRAAPDRLTALRRELPGMVDRRCGPVVYTKAVESAYRSMWEAYCGAPVT